MKKIVLLLAVLMIGTSTFAQHRKKKKYSMSHALGGSYIIYSNPDSTTGGIEDVSYTMNYTPRFNFYRVPKKDIVASIGSDVELGFTFTSYGGQSYTKFTYQVPIIASLNFGHASHPDSKSGFGGFIGFGYNFHSKTYQVPSSTSSTGIKNKNLMFTGVLLQGGLRFMMQGRSVTLKASYTQAKYDLAKLNIAGISGDYKLNIFGLSASTNIGEY